MRNDASRTYGSTRHSSYLYRSNRRNVACPIVGGPMFKRSAGGMASGRQYAALPPWLY
jgi:hypothetical protein